MIDYTLLSKSQYYYEDRGYRYIETPWLVSEAISDITRPIHAAQYLVIKSEKRKAFIASGEQGFLYLAARGNLPNGKYQTITPCIRNDIFDEFHTKYFMKNELIYFNPQYPYSELNYMVGLTFKFFKELIKNCKDLEITETNEGFDINLHGVEIGSYGIRECAFGQWVYGTGLALPRFSLIKRKFANDGI